MTGLPSLDYTDLLKALGRDGWVIVRQRGSHIRLHKRTPSGVLKLTVPAYKPIKRFTLSRILAQARLSLADLQALLWTRPS